MTKEKLGNFSWTMCSKKNILWKIICIVCNKLQYHFASLVDIWRIYLPKYATLKEENLLIFYKPLNFNIYTYYKKFYNEKIL